MSSRSNLTRHLVGGVASCDEIFTLEELTARFRFNVKKSSQIE